MSTKIHVVCDALGNPTAIHLTPGQAHDLEGADALLPAVAPKVSAVIADRAFAASERVVEPLEASGVVAVIPSKAGEKKPRKIDRHLYARRHLIENFFAKLKQWRGIATRYDKLARNFLAGVHLAAAMVWLN